jgi:hypothetical protein
MAVLSLEDVDGEDKGSKSAQTEEKEEKKEFSLYYSLIRTQCPIGANLGYSALHNLSPYSGMDHSRSVYSPPDLSDISV